MIDTQANWMVKGAILKEYLQACKEADMSNFKRDIRLNQIFEHSTVEQGFSYLNHVININRKLLDNVFTNDINGNPVIYNWGYGLYYSASTLQYIAVLVNLVQLCGSLDNLRIVEVGGGYGGQAKTVFDVFTPNCYHIIDLPEVTSLQYKYLHNIEAVDCFTQPTGQEYDLFISNYALSEIPDNGHLIELAGRCKHGYITCNTDLVTLPWVHDRRPDITNEPNNYILSW